MQTVSYSKFRTELSSHLDKVNEDHTPIVITRQSGASAVVMSLDDFNSYEETAYLLSNPKNAERLMRSINDIEAGNTFEKGLIEP